jgi:hypothetical protein
MSRGDGCERGRQPFPRECWVAGTFHGRFADPARARCLPGPSSSRGVLISGNIARLSSEFPTSDTLLWSGLGLYIEVRRGVRMVRW